MKFLSKQQKVICKIRKSKANGLMYILRDGKSAFGLKMFVQVAL